MDNLVRFGDYLVNLNYVAWIEGTTPVASVHMESGHPLYFDGPDGEAVRTLVRSYPKYPEAAPPPAGEAGETGYSAGPAGDPAANHTPKVRFGE